MGQEYGVGVGGGRPVARDCASIEQLAVIGVFVRVPVLRGRLS